MKAGTLTIVGGESLVGRELRDLLAERKLSPGVKLIGVDEDAAMLTAQDGEAVVMTPLDAGNLRGSRIAFLAGSAASSAKALKLAAKAESAPAFIDLTHAAEDAPHARLRAPCVEPAGYAAPRGTLHVVAHPAAMALALFLSRVAARHAIRRSIVHVFEPASERGKKGIQELERQTVSLLSFKPLPKQVFDAQLGFNMLSSYGSEAPEILGVMELRIERHLATLLAGLGGIPMPSLRLIQAPVFHGYSMSVFVEFSEAADAAALAATLAAPDVDVRTGDLEPPTSVGIAGQSGIAVGSIAADRNDPRACWFWVVADNLRLVADNALAVAQGLLDAKS